MDPTTAVAELRAAVVELGRLNTPDAPDDVHAATNTVLERWAALDTWLSNGGFPPVQWDQLTTRAAAHEDTERRVAKIKRELRPDPWGTHASLGALNGAIAAGEAVGRKLRGDA